MRYLLLILLIFNSSAQDQSDAVTRERDLSLAVGIDEIVKLDYKFTLLKIRNLYV